MANNSTAKLEETSSIQGTVKFFNHERGFGFISREDGGKDVYVHQTSIKSSDGFCTLKEGDVVSFKITHSDKGQVAVCVEVI